MTPDEQTLVAIRDTIAELSQEDQVKVGCIRDVLFHIVRANPGGLTALALLAMEMAVEGEREKGGKS